MLAAITNRQSELRRSGKRRFWSDVCISETGAKVPKFDGCERWSIEKCVQHWFLADDEKAVPAFPSLAPLPVGLPHDGRFTPLIPTAPIFRRCGCQRR